jgi:small-conductance mechanosensitive channel
MPDKIAEKSPARHGSYKIAVAMSLAVLAACVAGSFLTRGVMDHLPYLHGQTGGWNAAPPLDQIVDQRPWKTARALAELALTQEELQFAREAERLADHEVDQNFAQSLRQAGLDTKPLTGDALALQQRVSQLEQTVKADQDQVNSLTAKSSPTAKTSAATAPAGSDLSVAKAQLSLDQEELADSQEDLARASGDHRGKIQQELNAREASMKQYNQQAAQGGGQTAVVTTGQYKTLAGQISQWWAQRTRRQLIAQAEQLAHADVAALTDDYNRLKPEADAAAAKASAAGAGETSAARVKDLQNLTEQQNILSILTDRLGAQQQLVTLYQRWGNQVALQRKMLLHLMLRSLSFIAAIVLLTILAGWALQILFDRLSSDRRQRQTLRIILNLATQVVGLLLVLLVIFGAPQQTPTILGLATAGLTVVFQDFILAFCGWFVLMGRNGIRVGDWVEIDGVTGEAVEVGLFRTWLLETGNWTSIGHPTGRRVSFLNGFAIHGRYFNFSTAGQWMWDEFKVTIPAGVDAYPFLDKVREAAVKVTEADAKMAEEEWKHVTHEQGTPQFSAAPSVDMSPAGAGFDVVVRYITRAGARLETRNRLFATVVDLMLGARETSGNAAPQ